MADSISTASHSLVSSPHPHRRGGVENHVLLPVLPAAQNKSGSASSMTRGFFRHGCRKTMLGAHHSLVQQTPLPPQFPQDQGVYQVQLSYKPTGVVSTESLRPPHSWIVIKPKRPPTKALSATSHSVLAGCAHRKTYGDLRKRSGFTQVGLVDVPGTWEDDPLRCTLSSRGTLQPNATITGDLNRSGGAGGVSECRKPRPTLAKRPLIQPSCNISMFHDYAASMRTQDHSLQQLDLPLQELTSTQSLMYEEPEVMDQNALQSPCASVTDSTCSQFEAFDLKPQFEQSDDLLKYEVDLKELGQLEPELSHTSNLLWSSLNCVDNIKIEDVFQMSKGMDQGPTLNELNAVDSVSLVGDDTMDHLLGSLSSDMLGQTYRQMLASNATVFSSSATTSQSQSLFTLGDAAPAVVPARGGAVAVAPPAATTTSLSAKLPLLLVNPQTVFMPPGTLVAPPSGAYPSQSPAAAASQSTLHPVTPATMLAPHTNWASVGPSSLVSRGVKRSLSPCVETTGSVERKWEEIVEFIHDDLSKKIKTEPADVAYTPSDNVESQDEDVASDGDNSDIEEEDEKPDLSDNESVGSHSSFLEEFMTGRKDKRYFWQYNIQSKGPKGKRLCKTVKMDDPHILSNFEDPVFDPELNQNRYKHNGKARRGDGNDTTPNAWKLFHIGQELNMLGRELNDIVPVSEMPVGVRSKTRKEKNKFASRACRLKKKAQHEAHKLKLYGLAQEHQQLMTVLESIRGEITQKIRHPDQCDGESMTSKLDKLIKKSLTVMIAGHTTEYVNSVIEKIAAGDATGGLPIPPRISRTRSISE